MLPSAVYEAYESTSGKHKREEDLPVQIWLLTSVGVSSIQFEFPWPFLPRTFLAEPDPAHTTGCIYFDIDNMRQSGVWKGRS